MKEHDRFLIKLLAVHGNIFEYSVARSGDMVALETHFYARSDMDPIIPRKELGISCYQEYCLKTQLKYLQTKFSHASNTQKTADFRIVDGSDSTLYKTLPDAQYRWQEYFVCDRNETLTEAVSAFVEA